MIRAVFWDIDGTLIASGGAGVRAFGAVARHTFGSDDGVGGISFAGRTDVSIVREFFAARGIAATPENEARFLQDYVHWLEHYLQDIPGRVLPGVRDALAALRAMHGGPVLGLLTGNIRLGAELKLRRYGLWSEFACGAFSDDHHDRNRLAAIARDRGCELLGRDLAGSEMLVIGDTPLDIECARAVGARCLAVATGQVSRADLAAHRPDWLCDSLLDVDVVALCR